MTRDVVFAISLGLGMCGASLQVSAAPSAQFVDLSGLPQTQASALTQTTPRFVDLTGQVPSGRVSSPSAAQFAENAASASDVGAAPSDNSLRTRYFDLTTGRMVESTPPGNTQAGSISASYATDEAADPWEDFNRSHFGSHVFLQTEVIDPIEYIYAGVTPRFVRLLVHDFVSNLDDPKIFANDVLQIDLGHASATAARFVLNSTVGLGGTLDVASHVGIPFHDNDFGQTLATYGVGDAPYLLVPIVGPSNPRDLAGKIVDIFLDPLEYVTISGGLYTSIGHAALDQLDKRSEHAGRLKTLTDSASDPYAAERHDARTRRHAEIESRGIEDGD